MMSGIFMVVVCCGFLDENARVFGCFCLFQVLVLEDIPGGCRSRGGGEGGTALPGFVAWRELFSARPCEKLT